ncbi:hypothetical protein EJ06DRAFT_583006 [Trichodelitschia bisporula]|uniref:Altered inheritance of mitochondria protein 6 n=1 Tax=Trichodelitschia bisporula TaxID=703511 RepID=A0A6G1HT14_9PEZI|nr:hypothetical protein EJ06DRAFT_583006 [Trichodelitschia bisporula]
MKKPEAPLRASPEASVTVIEVVDKDAESQHTQPRRRAWRLRGARSRWHGLPAFERRRWIWWAAILILTLSVLGTLSAITYLSLLTALIRHLTPPALNNGLHTLLSLYPLSPPPAADLWLPNFSKGVQPKRIHSHNDYARDIPLLRALGAGCTGVEADIWPINGTLLVGHSRKALFTNRTLRSLYLDPLATMLGKQNELPRVGDEGPRGVFDEDPDETLVLLLDFKDAPEKAWPLVQSQLQPFIDNNYLTRWNGSALLLAPLTIVLSGLASRKLDFVAQSNGTAFLDAPLLDLPSGTWNAQNSLYASARAKDVFGDIGPGGLTKIQVGKVEGVVREAKKRGLRARVWGTPRWPVGLRGRVWGQLAGAGVGMLNVDEVDVAGGGDWGCKVAGIRVC